MGLRACLFRLRRWFRASPAAPCRGHRPQLEALETREVPAVALTDTYIASIYQGFLNRAADAAGLSFWNTVLRNTSSPATVVSGILASPEYQVREVQSLYVALLGRPVDTLGLRYWGGLLAAGNTYEQVKAGILGSQEYFQDAGNSATGWLDAVYRSQLGRNPAPAETSFWLSMLGGGPPARVTVAFDILNTTEARTVEVNSIYEAILSRPATPPETTFWDSVLAGGADVNFVLASVAGSTEYFVPPNAANSNQAFAQLNRFLLTTPLNFADPNSAASQFLNTGNKFSAVLPGVEQLDRLIPNAASTVVAVAGVTQAPTILISPTTANVTGTAIPTGTTFTQDLTTASPGLPITSFTNAFGVNSTPLAVGQNSTLFTLGQDAITGTANPTAATTLGVNPTATTTNMAPLTTGFGASGLALGSPSVVF